MDTPGLVGMSLRLSLVRHASTEAADAGRLNGWEDVPLNQRGHMEAAAVRLPKRDWAGVWSSDLSRAVQTAHLAGFDPIVDRRLRELDFGSLEGKAWDELDETTQSSLVEFDVFVAPGGESAADLRKRVRSFVTDLSAGDHLIFTHGGVIRLLLRTAGRSEHIPPGHTVEIELPIGSSLGHP